MIDTERLVADFIRLLAVNSPSRREGEVAAVIAESLRSLGLEVVVDDAGAQMEGDTGNIVATLPADGGRGKILLCAHMDTVAPTEGINIIREGGLIRQQGAAVLGADDKAGIAAIIEGIRSVKESGEPHGQIQVAMLICEEIGLFGAKLLDMDLVDSDLGYIFDSGSPVGHLVSSAPSHDNILAVFHGQSAHAGVCPEEGVSAIRAASLAVAKMPLGRIDFETTANVGIISGGSARNVIPERCEIKAEARSRNLEKLKIQVDKMTTACREAADEVGTRLEIEVSREYEGYRHAQDNPLVQFALKAAARVGLKPDLVGHGGGSDCNILNAKGLPCAVVGVGYEKIHTPEEYIYVKDLVKCAELAGALIRQSAE